MRLSLGKIAIVTVADGSVIRGRVVRSWRWRVVRLVEAQVLNTPRGPIPAVGPVLLPHRSIVLAQEVPNE